MDPDALSILNESALLLLEDAKEVKVQDPAQWKDTIQKAFAG